MKKRLLGVALVLAVFSLMAFAPVEQIATRFRAIYVTGNITTDGNLTVGGNIDIDGTTTVDGLDLDGQELTLDADADTSLTADTDDQIDVEISGADDFQFTANTFTALSGSTIAANTIAETTGANGVAVDGLIVKDGGLTLAASGVADLNGEADALVIDADADTTISAPTDDQIDIEIAGTDEITLTAAALNLNDTLIDQDIGTENIMLPTVASQAFTYTAAAGGTVALFTVADGEIWFVHSVIINVTTNFDCTGDDCVLGIGDGNDPNGFCDFVDAELQAADVETTGAPAGWQCFSSGDVIGAYFTSGRGFVYAPSGAAETIDAVLSAAGNDFSAGEATAYIVYTRLQ